MLIYRPDGDVDADTTALAPPVRDLGGARVAVLDNGKPNAVVAMRYDATEVMQGVTEVLAYGTAVQVEKIS